MPEFVLTYPGKPDIKNSDDGAKPMAAWKAWMSGLGAAVVDPGLPMGPSKSITPSGVEEGGGANLVSGITVMKAETMEDAMAMDESCPHLSETGTIEIAEALNLPM